MIGRYLFGVLVALDQLCNALLAGYPDETLSTRAARARASGQRWGCLLCRLLESIDRDHCTRSLCGKVISLARRYR